MYRYEPDSGCGLTLNEARDKGSQLAHERRHNNTTSRDLRIAYCSPPLTWHWNKHKVLRLHQRYIFLLLCSCDVFRARLTPLVGSFLLVLILFFKGVCGIWALCSAVS